MARLLVHALVRAAATLSVLTSSVPLALSAYPVMGLEGSKYTLLVPLQPRGADADERQLLGRKRKVHFAEGGITVHLRGIGASHRIQLLGCGIDQLLVLVVIVGGLGHDGAGAVGELHNGGHRQQVLIVAGIEEDAVLANRSAQGAAKLLLTIVRLIGGVRLASVESRDRAGSRSCCHAIRWCLTWWPR